MKLKFIYILFFLPGYIFSQSSILSTGNWIKIGIINSGIYRIDKDVFSSNGIDYNLINPKTLQLFGNGYNGKLPQKNSLSNEISPKEIGIKFFGNNNDVFEEDEYIYFYAQSSDKVFYDSINNEMQHEKNIYSDSSFYLLTYNQNIGKRIDEYNNGLLFDSLSNIKLISIYL